MGRERAALAAGIALIGLITAGALLAPWAAPEPNRVDLDAVLAPPSSLHWLGTDGLGRDVASRVLHGARVSLAVGLAAALLSVLIGLPVGACAGYFGGFVDAAVSRAIAAAMCFPGIVVAIAILSVGPRWIVDLPDAARMACALSVIGWTPTARYLRAEFQRLRSSDAVTGARASGAGHLRIVVLHLLPRSLAPVLVTLSFGIGSAALAEASLTFFGVGVSPPTPSWGELLYQALHHVGTAWWLALVPGCALFLLVLGCNRLAEGVRDWLDPRGHLP